MVDPTIEWRGFPRVVVSLTVWSLVFSAATLIQGDSITTTQWVCIQQYNLKNHSGEPVVASGYFVDKCVWVRVLMYICSYCLSVDVHLVLIYACVSILFPCHFLSLKQCILRACVTFFICVQMFNTYCMYASIHSLKSFMCMLSPVLDGLCVEFMEVCLIRCNTLLQPSVDCVEHLFSLHVCFLMWMFGYVFVCVCVRVCVVNECGRIFKFWNNIFGCLVVCCLTFVLWFH